MSAAFQHGEYMYEDNIDTGSIEWAEDENKSRGNWTGRLDFYWLGLASVSYINRS